MADVSEAPVKPGDVLAGKYRVERVLGAGGMGVVVAAHHIQLNERVALKFLLPSVLTSDVVVARFLREAQAAVRIKSEHVARVTDVGTLENGSPYMVMEYMSGSDLSDVLAQRGTLPVGDAVDYVLQACEAIAEAHANGIVHRDLKPSNLFMTKRADGSELVKVLDFGISKATVDSSQQQALTATSAVMGSPLYMSPDQITNAKDVDARADVWSLGVVLHELLTRAHPFTGETVPGLIANIVMHPPAPLRTMRADAPQALENVVLRCLEKDRARRFQTVAELAVALAPFAHERSRLSIERITRTLGAPAVASAPIAFDATLPLIASKSAQPNTANAWADSRPGVVKPRTPAALWVVGGGLALSVLLGGALLFRSQQHNQHPASVTTESATHEAPAPTAPPPPSAVASVVESAPTQSTATVQPAVTSKAGSVARSVVVAAHSAVPTATASVAPTAKPVGTGTLIDSRK